MNVNHNRVIDRAGGRTYRPVLTTGRWALLVAVLGFGMSGSPTVARSADTDAVESGRQSLRSSGSYPWYDRQTDDVRRIQVKPPRAASTRTTGSRSLFGSGDWFTPLAWVGIGTLLALVVYLLVRAYLAREKGAAGSGDEDADDPLGEQVDRVEDLPVRIRRPTSDLLTAAREQYEAGNYGEAIVYLYSHQLVQLDKRNLIRLTKGKTNRRYLREMSPWAALRGILEQTMVAFEDVFFGKHHLNRSRFEALWNRLDEFDSLTEQAASA